MPNNIPSKIASIVQCKCPRCRVGNVFKTPIYNLLKFHQTNTNCPYCGLRFEHETGFFWGAMYISYMFSSAIMLTLGIVGVNLDWSYPKLLLIIAALALILTPFSYRYSRILLLYWLSPNRKFQKG